MRRTLTAFAISICLAVPGVAQAQTIEGVYDVRGTNFDGSRYEGTAEIAFTGELTCEIIWETGATISAGICMRNGDSLAAAYELDGEVGLTIYQILPSGTLDGVWTMVGAQGNGTETLLPR
jgi:hypothetical protein